MRGVALIRPLAAEGRLAKRMGFQMMAAHDRDERVVRVRLKSVTPRARQACRVASGTTEYDSIEAAVAYGVLDDPIEAAQACARVALDRAREALE